MSATQFEFVKRHHMFSIKQISPSPPQKSAYLRPWILFKTINLKLLGFKKRLFYTEPEQVFFGGDGAVNLIHLFIYGFNSLI